MTGTAWIVALERFTGAYGSPPDFDDELTDRPLYLQLLEDEVRAELGRDMAAFFWAETEKLDAELKAYKRRREAGE